MTNDNSEESIKFLRNKSSFRGRVLVQFSDIPALLVGRNNPRLCRPGRSEIRKRGGPVVHRGQPVGVQPVLVQRPEVGDPRDEDVADGVKLDVADLLHLARGADDFERPPLAPVPEVELVVSGNDEELGEKKVNIICLSVE